MVAGPQQAGFAVRIAYHHHHDPRCCVTRFNLTLPPIFLLISASSIEDAKQKAEYDRMMKLAEAKKQEVRHMISSLRLQFKKLIHRNEELPGHHQLIRGVRNSIHSTLRFFFSYTGHNKKDLTI